MNNTSRRLRLYVFSVAFLTLAVAVLRSVALAKSFDVEIGYFAENAALPTLIYIMEAFCLFSVFSLFFLLPKGALESTPHPITTPGLVGAALSALSLLALAIVLITQIKLLHAPAALTVLAFLLLLVGAVYFGLSFMAKNAPASISLMLGYTVILGIAFLLAITYFDLGTQMNAPRKTSLHVCLLSVMLYMLYELRTLIGRPLPRVHLIAAAIAFFCCGSLGLSNAVGFLIGSYDSILYLLADLFAVSFAIYAGARAFAMHTAPAQAE